MMLAGRHFVIVALMAGCPTERPPSDGVDARPVDASCFDAGPCFAPCGEDAGSCPDPYECIGGRCIDRCSTEDPCVGFVMGRCGELVEIHCFAGEYLPDGGTYCNCPPRE